MGLKRGDPLCSRCRRDHRHIRRPDARTTLQASVVLDETLAELRSLAAAPSTRACRDVLGMVEAGRLPLDDMAPAI